MEDYADRSAELMRESKLEGDALFDLLQSEGGADQVVEIRNDLNAYRVSSSERVDRARDLDVPDGVALTADAMTTALGDQDRREGTEDVAYAMQVFLASDTIDMARFRQQLRAALEEEELSMPAFPREEFVPDVQWLDPAFVADQVNALRSGTGGAGDEAIELEEPIDTIAVGEIQTVTIPLTEQPPTGQNVPIAVEVEPVPGEEMTDNNVQEFSVIFTR